MPTQTPSPIGQTQPSVEPKKTMTIDEFGRSVKSKYPSYNNIDDAELGRKVLEKYPVYRDRVNDSNSTTGSPQTPATPPQQQKGVLERAAGTVNNAYEGYKNLPGVKQVIDVAGKVVGAPSAVIGGAVGALGTPIANAIKGRPLLENLKENTLGNAKDTYDFGYNIGKEGTAGVPLGAAGKAINIPMAFAQGYQGYTDVKQGIKEGDTEKALMGGLALGTAAISARSAAGEKGILLNQGPKQAVINRFPATKPVLAPVRTATEAVTSAAKPIIDVAKPIATRIINAAREAPITDNFKKSVKDLSTGRSGEKMSGADDALLNALEPSATIPSIDPKTGKAIPEQVFANANKKAEGLYQRFQNYRRIAEKAVKDPASPPPLEIAGRKAGDALTSYQQKLNKWGEIKKQELAQTGNKTVEVAPTIERLRNDLRGSLGVEAGIAPDGTLVLADAPGRRSKIALDPADQNLLRTVVSEMDRLGPQNSVTMIDDTIDALQDLLYKRKQNVAIPVNSQVERIIKKAVGELNSKLKQTAGPRYRKANDNYAYFVDTYQKLNKALGQDESKAASLAKRVFSSTDGGTRELFNQVKKDTGIDLVLEAKMAKEAGELAGDTRQRGLLEQVDMVNRTGGITNRILEGGIDLIKKQMADRESVIRRAGEQRRGLRREDL